MMQIEGLAAVVTGGGSGLGAATAAHLAALGCKVAVVDINQAAAEAQAARIGGIGAGLRRRRRGVRRGGVRGGAGGARPVRILVNCAGIGTAGRIVGRDGPLNLDAFERVIRVNLIGTFNMLRLAAAEMCGADPLEEGERGVIVNTASIAAFEGQVGQPAYAASKGGVVGMTLPAARELGPGRRAGRDDRARAVPYADGRRPAARDPGEPGRWRSLPAAARSAGGICRAGGAHRAQPVPERRGDPAGRRAADAAAVTWSAHWLTT